MIVPNYTGESEQGKIWAQYFKFSAQFRVNDLKASVSASKETLKIFSYRVENSENQTQFHLSGSITIQIEVPILQVFPIKIKELIRKEWNAENWNGDI